MTQVDIFTQVLPLYVPPTKNTTTQVILECFTVQLSSPKKTSPNLCNKFPSYQR